MNKEDMTMKKNIYSLAALLIASATFVACSSENDIISENQQPATPSEQVYTMSINASKGDGATTRALTLSGKTLSASWATSENVYVKKGSDWASGTLQPQADGATATLKGELSGIAISTGDALTLQFPKSGDISYSGQTGTLADIAANFDYATASVTVTGGSGGNITAADVTFTNQQAIAKFMLVDKANSAALNATHLSVTVDVSDAIKTGMTTGQLAALSTLLPTYELNPTAATYTANGGTGILFLAVPDVSDKLADINAALSTSLTKSHLKFVLTATVGSDTYNLTKNGFPFENGNYYEITAKMTKQASAATGHELSASAVGEVVGTDGLAYAVADKDNLPTGVTAAGMVAYKSGSNGLVIALADEASTMYWSTANGETGAAAHTPTVTGYSWRLPSMDEWKQMFGANGGNNESYTGLNTAINTAGGTALLVENGIYWTCTETAYSGHYIAFLNANVSFFMDDDNNANRIRACIAF